MLAKTVNDLIAISYRYQDVLINFLEEGEQPRVIATFYDKVPEPFDERPVTGLLFDQTEDGELVIDLFSKKENCPASGSKDSGCPTVYELMSLTKLNNFKSVRIIGRECAEGFSTEYRCTDPSDLDIAKLKDSELGKTEIKALEYTDFCAMILYAVDAPCQPLPF